MKQGLSIHGTAQAIRLINSLFYGRNENIPEHSLRIQMPTMFREIVFHAVSLKSFFQGFLLIFKFSENSPQTHREFPKKLSFTSYIKGSFPSFITFLSFLRFLRLFWSTCILSFVQPLNP